MKFIHWVHHLFNPHCLDCRDAANEDRICESCETLKMQLAIANTEKRIMLESLLEKNKTPDFDNMRHGRNLEELKPKQMTWNMRRQMLEAEDRKAAELLKKKAAEVPNSSPGQLRQDQTSQSIESLEKELGVETDAKSSNLHGEDWAG